MEPFGRLTSRAVALLANDVDTDVITPMKRLMERSDKPLAHYAFESLRYEGGDGDTGRPIADFALNRPEAADASILLVGENFGCGSSRESAPSALLALGFRCLVGPSFGDIFFGNCFQQGILPIVAPAETVTQLVAELAAGDPGTELTVDLVEQVIISPGGTIPFECNPFRRTSLLEGLDDIGMTLARQAEIDAFFAHDRQARPWIQDPPPLPDR